MIYSNVVEKCLQCAPSSELEQFAERLFSASAFELMTDKFANFVMQKALEVTRGDLQNRLLCKVAELSASLRMYAYGRHVLNAVERLRKSKRSPA